MNNTGMIFRVFVSSTFSDLQEERNALNRVVFPAIRQLCAENGCQFQAIDLRWGVGEEASLNQKTIKICLNELRRCQKTTPRPNFILLLGDRYGWQPLPEELPANEFEAILKHAANDFERDLLIAWYKKDNNAIPPVYDLLPRLGKYVNSDEWKIVESELKKVLIKTVELTNLNAVDLAKYKTSATEQEIIKGIFDVEDAHDHVFCFFRTIDNLTEDNNVKNYIDLDEDGRRDSYARNKLCSLKKRLKSKLPLDNIYEYNAKWNEFSLTTDHIPKFCKDVMDSLKKVILLEIKQKQEISHLDVEINYHKLFCKDRAKYFTGRDLFRSRINEYILGHNSQALCIYGIGGSGKSALTSFAIEDAFDRYPHAVVVYRFIGATVDSSDRKSLLESLCIQIALNYGYNNDISGTFEDLIEEFHKLLALASAEKPLFLFIDSLDQLSSEIDAYSIDWIPEKLPVNSRLIVTTRPGEYLNLIKEKLPPENIIELAPLSYEEGESLLDLWLQDAGRTLQEFQRKEVFEKFDSCRLPLYLKLAFEEVRLWKSYFRDIYLGEGIEDIIDKNFFRRIEDEHGKMLVSNVFGYFSATRNMIGLAEDEILDILALDKVFFDDLRVKSKHLIPEKKIPVALWSRLYFDLEPYLTGRNHEGNVLLTFFHRELGDVARSRYLFRDEIKYHQVLADYFLYRANSQDKLDDKNIKRNWQGSPRALSELPYHLINARRKDVTFQVLVDFSFIEQKSARVGVQVNIDKKGNKTVNYTGAVALLKDYDLALLHFIEDEKQF